MHLGCKSMQQRAVERRPQPPDCSSGAPDTYASCAAAHQGGTSPAAPAAALVAVPAAAPVAVLAVALAAAQLRSAPRASSYR